MKTVHAVLLSTALMGAIGAALGYLGYRLYRYGGGDAHAREEAALAAMQAARASASNDPAVQARAERAADEVLAPLRPRLDATARPVLDIELSAMADDELKASKVGGRPYWAAGREYPRDPEGRPLVLLAQIDLAEARLAGYPQTGLLQFFISGHGDFYGANIDDYEGRMQALAQPRRFRVVHWPQSDAPEVAPPAQPADLGQLPFDPAAPRRMRFSAHRESIGANDVGLTTALRASLDEAIEAYAAAHPEQNKTNLSDAVYERLSRSGHKFGGHPDFTQEDPREAGDRQVLLLQLDSDDVMMWGDSGIANFFIDPDDLARAKFDRVSYHWDCY
ncbi:MAG: DUF1963 domain-containing protein [Lysobacter sp.]|nr:DUF1963 domain-containing protein [Lysobacter sp.]